MVDSIRVSVIGRSVFGPVTFKTKICFGNFVWVVQLNVNDATSSFDAADGEAFSISKACN
jgi:hypothetical protein